MWFFRNVTVMLPLRYITVSVTDTFFITVSEYEIEIGIDNCNFNQNGDVTVKVNLT